MPKRRHQREHDAFSEHVPEQPAGAAAKRQAHGVLLTPLGGAAEQQIGHVGAREQMQQRHRGQQHEERPPDGRIDARSLSDTAVAVTRSSGILADRSAARD